MAVILFPNKDEMARFCNSEFRGSVLCPERLCSGIQPNGRLEERERKVLSEIEETVIMVREEVERLINIIPFPEITHAFRYENGFTNWRDRSHLIKLSLGLINKKADEDVVSIMALIEIFYLSWLLVDEYFDETDKCEGKSSYYKFLKNPKSITCIAEAINTIASHVFEKVIRNKALGEDGYRSLFNIFSEMKDRVQYGLYLDLENEVVFKKNQSLELCSLEATQALLKYLLKIEYLWGSQFEAGVKLALALFDDVREDKAKTLAYIAKNWGILFKLRDDILDAFGDKEGLGRDPGEDIIVEGNEVKFKLTLPLILFLWLKKKKNEQITMVKNQILNNIKGEKELLPECKNYLIKYASKIENALRRFEDNSAKESMIDLLILVSRVRI